VTRAITDVNCQCHFVGYLLENDASIDVFKHERSNDALPPPVAAERNC
jgi:hypothetical protein